jgi:hypothetical protein
MLKQKLQTWTSFSELMKRATETFEKKSGWKTKDVRSTLDKFSNLDGGNKLLLGGLLVGEALRRGNGHAKPAPKRKPRARKPAVLEAIQTASVQ